MPLVYPLTPIEPSHPFESLPLMPSHAAASRGSISPAIAYQQDPQAKSVSFIGSKPDHPLPKPKPHLQAHQAIEEDLSAKEIWYNWGSRVVDPGLE